MNENNCDNSEKNETKTLASDTEYHAVFIPLDPDNVVNTSPDVHIYTSKVDALKDIKKHKSGRLKTFKTLHEAEEFAKHGSNEEKNQSNKDNIPVIKITQNSEEKSSTFKGPSPQELVAFRKLIEKGEIDEVKEKVWSNPRFLISSGDTPAILQEGARYNAAHIAAFKATNNEAMLKLILDTVSDPKFVGLMYGKEEDSQRAQILLDLYLNTPDKGLNETPLHFAVKFGHLNLVKLLVSYPQCQKDSRNKWGQVPAEIVCTRKGSQDKILVNDICTLLTDQYYVPVLRAEDNILQPIIGEPFLPVSPPRLNLDPFSPKIEVAAFAGPMSKPQAMEFRKKWKTPPRRNLTPNYNNNNNINNNKENINHSFDYLTSPKTKNPTMRYQDSEKGLERVGRDLAEEYHVAWKEFWPFLDNFADLRCAEGLEILEKHFLGIFYGKKTENNNNNKEQNLPFKLNSARRNRRSESLVKNRLFTDVHDDNDADVEIDGPVDEIDALAERLGMCSLGKTFEQDSNSDDEDEFYTPSSSPLPEKIDSEAESSDEELVEAEEGDAVFIDGKAPGKTDFAVLNAIPDYIDSEIYPCIYKWKHEVQLATRRHHFNFATPRRLLL